MSTRTALCGVLALATILVVVTGFIVLIGVMRMGRPFTTEIAITKDTEEILSALSRHKRVRLTITTKGFNETTTAAAQPQIFSVVRRPIPNEQVYLVSNFCISGADTLSSQLVLFPFRPDDIVSMAYTNAQGLPMTNEYGSFDFKYEIEKRKGTYEFETDIPVLVTPVSQPYGWHMLHSLVASTKLQRILKISDPFHNFLVMVDEREELMKTYLVNNPYEKLYELYSPTWSYAHWTGRPRCFREGYVGVPLMLTGSDQQSITATDMDIFRRRTLDAMGAAQDPCPPPPARRCRLTLAARRNSRKITNMAEVENVTRSMGFNVQVVEWEDMPMTEQIHIAANTDVMLGVHGNNLLWHIFMTPRSILFELGPCGANFVDGKNANRWSNYGGLARLAEITTFHWQSKQTEAVCDCDSRDWRQCDVFVNLSEFAWILEKVRDECAQKCTVI